MTVYHQYTAESDNQHLIRRRRGWLRLSRSTQSVLVEIIGWIEVVARFRRRRTPEWSLQGGEVHCPHQ